MKDVNEYGLTDVIKFKAIIGSLQKIINESDFNDTTVNLSIYSDNSKNEKAGKTILKVDGNEVLQIYLLALHFADIRAHGKLGKEIADDIFTAVMLNKYGDASGDLGSPDKDVLKSMGNMETISVDDFDSAMTVIKDILGIKDDETTGND